MNTYTRKTLLASMVGLLAAGGGSGSLAQGGEAATEQGRIDEIVVTAQKREQSLQDTPLSISAITASSLEARGIESGIDLQFSVPGLSLGESNTGPAQITVRGIGMENIFLGGDPGVPIHINGHYIQDTSYILQDFLDIERIEVLRGPQGTLYGRNAIGGNINVITKRPTEEFEAFASLDFGNYSKRLAQISVSGSVAEKFRARIAVSDENRAGYVENISTVGGDNFKDSDYTSIRGVVEYDVTDTLMVAMSGYYFEDFGNNVVARRVTDNPTSSLPGFVDYFAVNGALPNPTVSNPRQVRLNITDDASSRAKGGSVDVEWDMMGLRFRSLSSYNNSDSLLFTDSDGSDVVTVGHDHVSRSHETFSQELQVLSNADDSLNWILGLFYYSENSQSAEIFDWDNLFVADGSKTVVDFTSELRSEAIGVFGQIEYPLTDKLFAVAGLRYNKDKKSNIGGTFIPAFGVADPSGGPLLVFDSDEWSEVTGKFGLNYHVHEDLLLFASFTTGYKAGGYNNQQPVYDPETVDAFELGIKGLWLDQTVQGSFSAFHYDYAEKQEFQRDPSLGIAFITNAGAATLWGMEIEGVANPFPGMMIDLSIAYLNAEYDEFDTLDGLNPGLGVQDLSGNDLPRTPEWKFHIGLEYEWSFGEGMLAARLDAVWVDEQFSAPFNRLDRDLMDSYHRTNAQLNWESDNQLWAASFYVKNIEDDDVLGNLFDGGETTGIPVAVYGHYFSPRTYGVKFSRHF